MKTIVVVLGMHRSGTSVITRALQVLGVQLGENLLEAQGDNKKGFFEDADIVSLNDEVLFAVGSRWHFHKPITKEDVAKLTELGFVDKAIQLIKQKTSNANCFGMKDPRVAKLLPFWMHVFSQFEARVKYVVAIRNPLDVAHSLEKRNGMSMARSYLSWFEHTVTSLYETQNDQRVIIEYDEIVLNPEKELRKISHNLSLDIDDKELVDFKEEFIDTGLRHNTNDIQQLMSDDNCPVYIKELYKGLTKVLKDEEKFSDLEQLVTKAYAVLRENVARATWEDSVLLSNEELNNTVYSRDVEIINLENCISERDNTISDKEDEVELLKHQCQSYSEQIDCLINSTSWKITRPVRAIKYIIAHYKRTFANISFVNKLRILWLIVLTSYRQNGFIVTVKKLFAKLLTPSRWKDYSFSEVEHSEDDYSEWLKSYDAEIQYNKQHSELEFKQQPVISIIVPVYNTDKQYLIKCIESVIAQSYANWQLCLCDDKSTLPHIKEVLDEYSSKDPRINAVYRETNGHISAASNSALEIAIGEWSALLDHDDELHKHALFYVVKAINDNPQAQLIYTDEDKINTEGVRTNPHFKSNWNLDLLYSQNYVSHLGVYKTEIVKSIGGFRLGFEGSQDYDLLLRYSEKINHNNVIHVPKVLYHWRMIEGSTSLSSGEKSYTTDAGIKALKDYFQNRGDDVEVARGLHENIYKVTWKIKAEPLVSLVIPTHNGYEITKNAIDSILDKSTYRNFEIILVDNNSNDPIALEYFQEISHHEKVMVLRYPYPFNYSAINNFAVEHAKGEIIGLINNDVEVISPEWLTEMVSHAQREDIGCVGAMLYYSNDTIQHAGVILGIGGVAGHSHKHYPRNSYGYFSRLKIVQNLSAVTAACLLVRKSVFNEVNGLNEKDLTIAFNDIDFCLKVQNAGYRNIWTPYAELYHHESISRGAEDNPEKVARFNKEVDYMKVSWDDIIDHDPYYNVNLTLIREDFSLNFKY